MPTMPAPPPAALVSPINCWATVSASSPPATHQRTTPNQSPSPQMYQSSPTVSSAAYTGYYSPDIPSYQSPEYLMSPDLTYTQLGSTERTSSVIYKTDHGQNCGSVSQYIGIKSECPGRADDTTESVGLTSREWAHEGSSLQN